MRREGSIPGRPTSAYRPSAKGDRVLLAAGPFDVPSDCAETGEAVTGDRARWGGALQSVSV